MGLRERTPRALKQKQYRCSKCGKHLARWRRRCKACGLQQR